MRFFTSGFFHESVSLKPLSKFAKIAKQLFFVNLQIIGLNPQSQICKFLRYASPQISFDWSANCKSANFVGEPIRKLQICKFSTIKQREIKKIPSLYTVAKLSKRSQLQVCLPQKFELEHFRYVFVSRKIKNSQICESCRSTINFADFQRLGRWWFMKKTLSKKSCDTVPLKQNVIAHKNALHKTWLKYYLLRLSLFFKKHNE